MGKEVINSESVRDGLSKILEDLNVSVSQFAVKTGLDVSNFSKKLKGYKNFTKGDMIRFKEANISLDFLNEGKGAMYIGPVLKNHSDIVQDGVPVFDEEFSCGFLTFGNANTHPVGYADMPNTRGADCWCRATGDSMQPLINNGDYVCLKRVEEWGSFLELGKVYAIDTYNDQRMIKKIMKGDSDETYTLVSLNTEYEPQLIRKDMIRTLYRVINVQKTL